MTAKLLVVEDTADARLLLRAMLGDVGDLEVEFAVDGTQARQMLAGNRYDLVLLDLMLPDANGLDILRDIKAVWPDQKVVVVSAIVPMREVRQEAYRAGAVEVVEKPFSIRDLRSLVEKHLSGREHVALLDELRRLHDDDAG